MKMQRSQIVHFFCGWVIKNYIEKSQTIPPSFYTSFYNRRSTTFNKKATFTLYSFLAVDPQQSMSSEMFIIFNCAFDMNRVRVMNDGLEHVLTKTIQSNLITGPWLSFRLPISFFGGIVVNVFRCNRSIGLPELSVRMCYGTALRIISFVCTNQCIAVQLLQYEVVIVPLKPPSFRSNISTLTLHII